VAFSPDGDHVASGSYDQTVGIWSASTGARLKTFKGHTDWITSVAYSPDGDHVVSGSDDKTVRIWVISKVAVFVKTHLKRFNDSDTEDEDTYLLGAAAYLRKMNGKMFRDFHERLWMYVNEHRPDFREVLFKVDRLIEEHILKEQVEHDWNEIKNELEKRN